MLYKVGFKREWHDTITYTADTLFIINMKDNELHVVSWRDCINKPLIDKKTSIYEAKLYVVEREFGWKVASVKYQNFKSSHSTHIYTQNGIWHKEFTDYINNGGKV